MCILWYIVKKSSGFSKPTKCAFASLIALSVCASFSYPFQIVHLQLIIAVLLSVISSSAPVIHYKIYRLSVAVINSMLMMISAFLILEPTKDLYYLYTWETKIREKNLKDATFDKKMFRELYPQLSHNKYFLYNYSMELLDNKYYSGAINTLNETGRFITHPDILIALGDAYKESNQFSSAQRSYVYARRIVPNRITPDYKLFRLYRDQGYLDSALVYAHKILNHSPKVNNYKVTLMKEEVTEYINYHRYEN